MKAIIASACGNYVVLMIATFVGFVLFARPFITVLGAVLRFLNNI